MHTICPVCGLPSLQEDFCEACQTNTRAVRPTAAPADCPVAESLSVPLTEGQRAALGNPRQWALVEDGGRSWRAHWIGPDAWKYWGPFVRARAGASCPVLPPARVVERPDGVWVVVEASGQAVRPWEQPKPADPIERVAQAAAFARRLGDALESLHESGLLWLTFHPEAVEAAAGDPGGLWLANLDLRVFPARQSPGIIEVSRAFAAPEVWADDVPRLGPATDVYHLAAFAYYQLAGLLPAGFPGQGLPAFEFAFPPLRILVPDLPPRVASVLETALDPDPARRFPAPPALADALDDAVGQSRRRWSSSAPVRWEIGWKSRAGRVKEALFWPNEDHVLVREFADPPRALAAVADGISTCDVGNGALASRLACLILDNTFHAGHRAAEFAETLAQACRRGTQGMLDWAREQNYHHLLQLGRQLMGSTLTAAWLEGHWLHVGNLGDSRAYLVAGGQIEQLTVDGDLRSDLLSMRVPPEEVLSVGSMARALRTCVGGCTCNPQGKVVIAPQQCTPTMSRWPLCPGDVLILCTDGLIDEEVFLEPAEAAEIVRSGDGRSAEELATLLIDAADARQRLPSPLEPEGFGDNISVIVVKVLPA